MAGPSKTAPTEETPFWTTRPPSYDSISTNDTLAAHIGPPNHSDPTSVVLPQGGLDQIWPTSDDGRLIFSLGKNAAELYSRVTNSPQRPETPSDVASVAHDSNSGLGNNPPRLNIVLQVVGSRGDVQPFLALAKGLQQSGHRVRLATHPAFRDLVESYDVEFFSIGGDPKELMAYMVRNPGLMPKFAAFRQGEVYRRRRAMREILRLCWRSCYEPALDAPRERGRAATAHTKFKKDAKRSQNPIPFVADAIIANPPCFAHIHCAEKLGIPLHIVFT